MKEYTITFFNGAASMTLHIVCNDDEIKDYLYSILQGSNTTNEKIKPCKYINKTGFYYYSKKKKTGAYIITKM